MKKSIIFAAVFTVTVLHGAFCIYTTGHVSSMFLVYMFLSISGLMVTDNVEPM
jgi:hypothetical protein